MGSSHLWVPHKAAWRVGSLQGKLSQGLQEADLPITLFSCAVLAKLLSLLDLSFLICRIGLRELYLTKLMEQ